MVRKILKKNLHDRGGFKLEIDSIVNMNDSISKGLHGIILKRISKVKNHCIELIEKAPKRRFSEDEIGRQLKIYQILKKSKIKTFKTFRSDGKSFFMSSLNRNNIIALSSKNKTPDEYFKKFKIKKMKKIILKLRNLDKKISESNYRISINNFDDVLEEIRNQANLLQKNNISVQNSDSLFYLVDFNKQNTNLDFLIGDFDNVKEIDGFGRVSNNNMIMLQDFYSFIESYMQDNEKYLKKIQNTLDKEWSKLESNE